jgi:hypothetical protein
VAGSHVHVVLVKHLAHVVQVYIAERKRECCPAQLGVGRSVNGDVIAVSRGEGSVCVTREFDFVPTNLMHTNALQKVDGLGS